MKYILVTGAFGGMGKAVTELLVSNGFKVIAIDRSCDFEREDIIPIKCDITNEKDLERVKSEVLLYTDSIYAIIHFAGIYRLDSFVEAKNEVFDKLINVNFIGAVKINNVFFPLLEKGGRIIHVTSELADLDPMPFTGMYAVSKIALDNYAFSLRMELQLKDIFVSVLRSGAVKTSMIGDSTDELDKFCKNTKLYTCNAKRFKRIVDSVEAKSVSADKLAVKVLKILMKNKPKFSYSFNRNPLLILYGFLPKYLKFKIIKLILK